MGVSQEQYKNFTMLKKRLLDIPVKEINEKTDLFISYQLEKYGRTAEAIIFKMITKEPAKTEEDVHGLIRERLLKYGIKESQIEELLKRHDEQYLLVNLEIVEEKIKKGEIQNIPAYLLKAFQSDFRMAETQYTKEQKEKALQQQQIKEDKRKAKQQQQQTKEEFRALRQSEIEQVLSGL